MRKRKSARRALGTVDKNTLSKGKMSVKKKSRSLNKKLDSGDAKLNHAAVTDVPGDDTQLHAACWWSDWKEQVDANKCRDFSKESFGKGNETGILSSCSVHCHTRAITIFTFSLFAQIACLKTVVRTESTWSDCSAA